MARYTLLSDGEGHKSSLWSRVQSNPKLFITVPAAVLGLIVALGLLWTSNAASLTTGAFGGSRNRDMLHDTQNATLGFQKLLVINFPDRSDKRDKMSIMAATTGMHFDYLPGISGDAVPDKAMPPGPGGAGGVRGSWRAHINALRHVVENNMTSAVIFEDDMDWDLRIKQQMHDYALTTRALVQPLRGSDQYADPTFPVTPDPKQEGPHLDTANLPRTAPPRLTPYGDKWDILWLGHCGARRPVLMDTADDWHDISSALPKGVVVQRDDMTVPKKEHLHWHYDMPYEEFRRNFPPHSRATHHMVGAVCTFAYGVTQAGARKILYELGIEQMNDPFDLMLRDFCDRRRGHEGNGAICLTVQPSLFSHFIHDDAEDGQRPYGYRKTVNLRYSTWANLEKLLRNETDYVDQWPD